MTEANRWRRRFATRVAGAYRQEQGVAAVVIGGSAARGHADRYSDVEIGVLWHRPPTDEDRRRITERIEGDGKRIFPFDESGGCWEEEYYVGRARAEARRSGLLIEVASHTTQSFERTLDEVLTKSDPEPLKQNLIAGVTQGIPLKGADLVAHWREAAAAYSESLATAVVSRWGQIDHFWRWKMWLERDNLLMFHQKLGDVQKRVLHMLLAVNRTYFRGFKWLHFVVDDLETAPKNLRARLTTVSRSNDATGPRVLADLVEETYDLVEAFVPDVDVPRLRSIFRWKRPEWGDTPPPWHPGPSEPPDEVASRTKPGSGDVP